MDAKRTAEGIEMRMEEVWLNAHPLTDYLLREETEFWSKIGRHLSIQKF